MRRLVHRTPHAPPATPLVVGLDEWAWRWGQRFGTIVCDLERRRVVNLLPDRFALSVAQRLYAPPSVDIVCRKSGNAAAGGPGQNQSDDRANVVGKYS